MSVVLHDFVGLLRASPAVNVLQGWSFIACEKLFCLDHLLYSFTVQGGAFRTPHSDAAATDTLHAACVDGAEDLWSLAGFLC